MTKQMILTAGLLLVGAVAAPAQSMRAKIPFDFQAGNQTFKAGEYEVVRSRQVPAMYAYTFRNVQEAKSQMVATTRLVSIGQTDQSQLVFRCASGQCELSEIWSEAASTRVEFTPKKVKGAGTEIATIRLSPGF